MRRKDREVTGFSEIMKIVEQCEIVRLGLSDGDYPYIVPMNFAYEVKGEQLYLYVHGAMAGRRYELLTQNPVCSFEMDKPLYMDCITEMKNVTMRYLSVMGKAAVTFLEGEDKKRAVDEVIMARHEETKNFVYNESALPRTAVLKLTVTEISAKANLDTERFVHKEEQGVDCHRAQYRIEQADVTDKEKVLALYQMQLGREYCAWDDHYPGMKEIEFDLARDALFAMKDENGEIVASISIDEDEAVKKLTCWRDDLQPGGELARLAVHPSLQNKGMAREMLKYGMQELKKRGYQSVHFLVNKENKKALRSYAVFQFPVVGECEMFGQPFFCYESKL